MGNKLKTLLVVAISAFQLMAFAQDKIKIRPDLPTVDDFLAKPFGVETNRKNLQVALPWYKMKIATISNRYQATKTDTFFDFRYGKSRIVIVKVNGRETLLEGKLTDSKTVLANGIKIGISRYEFFKSFANLKASPGDTLVLSSESKYNAFTFIFKNKELSDIIIGVRKTRKNK
jgi:hypothetical protein